MKWLQNPNPTVVYGVVYAVVAVEMCPGVTLPVKNHHTEASDAPFVGLFFAA